MSIGEIRGLLERHGLHLQRDRGQNFLVDPSQADRLARLAGVEAGDSVVEVGTGLGLLTRELARRARRVVTIEVDSGVVRALRAEALLADNVELVHADALSLDLRALVEGLPPPVRLVANLPYSAASPLLRRLLDLRDLLTDWSVMVQRELAERLLADPGSRDYGSFTVLHALLVSVSRELDLHPRCFFPAPRVHSTFIRLRPLAASPVADGELESFEKLLRSAFAARRKTLLNALRAFAPELARDSLASVLEGLGIDPRVRGETLSPETWLQLSRALVSERHARPAG